MFRVSLVLRLCWVAGQGLRGVGFRRSRLGSRVLSPTPHKAVDGACHLRFRDALRCRAPRLWVLRALASEGGPLEAL